MPKINGEIRGPKGLCSDPVGPKPEMVNHPQHYAFRYEPIDVINDWGLDFNLGNTVKYIARCERKGNKIQDLEKAKFYLEDEIRRMNNG